MGLAGAVLLSPGVAGAAVGLAGAVLLSPGVAGASVGLAGAVAGAKASPKSFRWR